MSPNGGKKQKADPKSAKETIHSGHFMVSDIDDSEVQDGDESPSLVVHESDCEQESSPIPEPGFDFESACKETSKTYVFGPRSSLSISIDASLTKLFECMTLAYSGKLTSPRWKQFKGLKLRLKEKIRLNNMIWRAWHMQFVMKLKTFVCQFATPLDGEMHTKPEAVVIEGTYWKRRMANITAEYKKWRLFSKDRFKVVPTSDNENMFMDYESRWSQRSVDSFPGCIDEDFIMDFSDTLFSTFNPSQPFDFPNPREIAARAGIADFIQPGLVQLQPCVDDFMDTFEPLQDFLNAKLPTLPEETSPESSNQSFLLSSVTNPELNLFDVSQSNTFHFSSVPSTSTESRKRSSSSDFKRKTLFRRKSQEMNIGPPENMIVDSFMNLTPSEMMQQATKGGQNLQNTQLPCTMRVGDVYTLSKDNLIQNTQQCLSQNTLIETSFLSPVVLGSESCFSKPNTQSSQVFQHSVRNSGMLHANTMNLNSKPNIFQSNHPAQVPLSTASSINSVLSSANAQISKNQNVAQFINIDLRQAQSMPQIKPGSNGGSLIALDTSSFPASNVFSVQLPMLQPKKKEPVDCTELHHKTPQKSKPAETQVFRRHSYATGQQLQPVLPQVPTDPVVNRRSRRIAPAAAIVAQSAPIVNFAVPEIPSRHRTRSRSVSSPQGGSPKAFVQQSSQAVSLTDISVALATQLSARRERPLAPDVASLNREQLMPQNIVLTQLLTSGRDSSTSPILKDTNQLKGSASPVAILESLPSLVTTTAQTFVISSLPLTTVSGVSDFQRGLLVGAANQVFSSQANTCNVPSPLANNSSSSSAASPIASPGSSFDASSSKVQRLKSDQERTQYKEHRRVCHINAEQKRRCNIKNGFESLHNLLPPLNQNPNAKFSKAALLQKGADYIRQLKTERQQQQDEAEALRKEIEELNQSISHYQSQLPASGVPVPCQKTNRMKEMFEEYVRQQTLKNWKFWIFSLILEPLVESYSSNVSTASVDEMCKTILSWLDQHCSLVALRPGVLNSLRHLSTTTNILADPSCMPEEATRAVTKKESRQ